MLGVFGSAAENPVSAHDIDFFLVVDAVEHCVTYATQDCRARFPQVQFFVMSAEEYARIPTIFRFQIAFAYKITGDLALPIPTQEDAAEAICHGFTDSLRTLRQQFKRNEWTSADDWARQVWWSLKSFKYALLDLCWVIRETRPRDPEVAAVILEGHGLNNCARAVTEWPSLEEASSQLTREPLVWIHRWELIISAAYAEAATVIKKRAPVNKA